MSTNYRGESYAKKLARLTFWDHSQGNILKPGRKTLVLASEHGGDVAVLKSAGCPNANIIAVDKDMQSLKKFIDKYPRIQAYHGDAAAASKLLAPSGLDCAFLDFCSNINDNMLQTLRGVYHTMKHGSLLGINILRGRDCGRNMKRIKIVREIIKSADNRATFKGFGTQNDKYLKDAAREAVIRNFLNSACDQDTHVWPRGIIKYCSASKGKRGSTFLTLVYNVFWGKYNEYVPTSLLGEVKVEDFTSLTAEQCKEIVMRLSIRQGNMFGFLNVPKMRAAAWRAHSTMGTYNKAPRAR